MRFARELSVPDIDFIGKGHPMINLGGWPSNLPLDYAIIVDNNIHDFEGSGVYVHSNNATVTGNTFENLYRCAIEVEASPNALIANNDIENIGMDPRVSPDGNELGTGISLINSIKPNVSFNTISNVRIRGFGWRVFWYSDFSDSVSGVLDFEGNTVDGEEILMAQSLDSQTIGPGYKEVIVHNCTDIIIDGYSGHSLAASFCDGLTIQNSYIEESPVEVTYCSEVNMSNNTVNNTLFGDALTIAKSSQIQVFNNSLIYGLGFGMNVVVSSIIEIADNTVRNQRWWGIAVRDCEDASVTGNRVLDSGAQGIVCDECPEIVVDGNMVDGITGLVSVYPFGYRIGYAGVSIDLYPRAVISSNLINNVLSDGIWVDTSDEVSIEGNIITNLPGRGMFLTTCRLPVLRDNQVRNATWMGMGFSDCKNLRISDIILKDIHATPILWHNKWEVDRFIEFENVSHNQEPVLVFQDQKRVELPSGISSAVFINCSSTVISGFVGDTLIFSHSPDCIITNSEIEGGYVSLEYSPNATIAKSNVLDIPKVNISHPSGYVWWGLPGISLYSCENGLVINNLIRNTSYSGISIFQSIPCRVIANTILATGEHGIHLGHARDTLVTANFVNNSLYYSLYLESSTSCDIYLNQLNYAGHGSAFVDDETSNIRWDNGTHGNYYFNYEGIDANNDGVGDTPYVIDYRNADDYPLMGSSEILEHQEELLSYGPHIASTSISPAQPLSPGQLVVSAVITSTYRVAYVILSYSLDAGGTWTNTTMFFSDGKWSATLTSFPDGIMNLKIYAFDSIGNWHILVMDDVSVISILSITLIGVVGGIAIVAVVIVFIKKRKS